MFTVRVLLVAATLSKHMTPWKMQKKIVVMISTVTVLGTVNAKEIDSKPKKAHSVLRKKLAHGPKVIKLFISYQKAANIIHKNIDPS